MAEVHKVEFMDDWDHKPIEMDELVRTHFTVEGVEYKLDLRQTNFDRFLKDMGKWIDKAERVGGRAKPRANKPSAVADRSGRKEQLQAIRDWANDNGYEVSSRGKIPLEVHDAFERAHS